MPIVTLYVGLNNLHQGDEILRQEDDLFVVAREVPDTWNMEAPGREVRVGDIMYEYQDDRGWSEYSRGPRVVSYVDEDSIFAHGSVASDFALNKLSGGKLRSDGMKRLYRGPVVPKVASGSCTSCGGRVSGAMLAIGAVHLCP